MLDKSRLLRTSEVFGVKILGSSSFITLEKMLMQSDVGSMFFSEANHQLKWIRVQVTQFINNNWSLKVCNLHHLVAANPKSYLSGAFALKLTKHFCSTCLAVNKTHCLTSELLSYFFHVKCLSIAIWHFYILDTQNSWTPGVFRVFCAHSKLGLAENFVLLKVFPFY